MDISIIIVNWNSATFLQHCLMSLYACHPKPTFEVIVVDSGSFDGCGTMVACQFPDVRFVQCEENVGFAKANNLGVEQAQGACLLFLNPDTEVVGTAVDVLHEALQRLKNAGIVGAKLLNTDRSLQTSCVQAFPTILNQLLDFEVIRGIFPRLPFWGMAPLFAKGDAPIQVQMLSGACLMMRRTTFNNIGGFDEEYFMYAEDTDLCYKAMQFGYENYYVPRASIIHHGGGSSQKSEGQFSAVMTRCSIWRFLTKTRGCGYGMAYRRVTLLSAGSRLFLLALGSPLFLARGKAAKLLNSFRKWLAILNWSVGCDSWLSRRAATGSHRRSGNKSQHDNYLPSREHPETPTYAD